LEASLRSKKVTVVETAKEAVGPTKLLRFLESDRPASKNEDHPELARGSAKWVGKIRNESSKRSQARLAEKNSSRKLGQTLTREKK
jgi:hypothetical protein